MRYPPRTKDGVVIQEETDYIGLRIPRFLKQWLDKRPPQGNRTAHIVGILLERHDKEMK